MHHFNRFILKHSERLTYVKAKKRSREFFTHHSSSLYDTVNKVDFSMIEECTRQALFGSCFLQ